MVWSVSTAKMFERCQRQWFFKTKVANALAKNETRQRAYRLSKLQSVSSWRGNVVDQVLSKEVIPAIQRGWTITLEHTINLALERFDRQLAIAREHRILDMDVKPSDYGDDLVAFHCLEYEKDLNEAEIVQARREVVQAIQTFFEMHGLIDRLRTANRLLTQRSLTFKYTDVSVRAVPDVIALFNGSPPAIIDWKVHTFGWRDAWLQLAVYALALTRCKPHIDFPIEIAHYIETDVELVEVQLLTGKIRTHKLEEKHFSQADTYIARTAESMELAIGQVNGKVAALPPTLFPVTYYPGMCERCPYRSLCWETVQ